MRHVMCVLGVCVRVCVCVVVWCSRLCVPTDVEGASDVRLSDLRGDLHQRRRVVECRCGLLWQCVERGENGCCLRPQITLRAHQHSGRRVDGRHEPASSLLHVRVPHGRVCQLLCDPRI